MLNKFNSIPEELRLCPQWIVWRYEDIGAKKPTKVPYDPKTGKHADVNKPETWTTFEEAIKTVDNFSGIGFVFSDSDPYTFIDLDDTDGDAVAYERQLKIFKELDSYAEISPSGKGLHIIIKGAVPSGRRRSFIEVYSSQRYATMTGNVYHEKSIENKSNEILQLWEQMGSGPIATNLYKGDDKEVFNDRAIVDQALSAINGEKFKKLNSGQWQELYQSQSEADFAFVDIIAFYTQNRKQIERIFRASPLGQRDKAKRKDYVTWMINKSFDRMLPPIDFDGFKIALDNKINGKKITKAVAAIPDKPTISIPPGLMGELAQFIYAAAPRPVPEVALAGAIGLMAGIAGRAYNISGTGLNQYVLLIAQTGIGKESLSSGIDRLMNAIRMQVPTSNNFIGPSEIASGQALTKHLSKTSQCFVSILGEFGLRLQAMSSQNANGAEIGLRRMLLDLYNKSGHGQTVRSSIYADREKNTDSVLNPAFSILGESTPERFYGALNEEMISEGLLPRFMLIEYNGIRPKLNKNHLNVIAPFTLIDKLASLAANAEIIMHAKKVINVEMSLEALKISDEFDEYSDAQINGTNKEVLRQLWNRAHMKVLKMSGLIAVGVNMNEPVVQPEYVNWAIDMVQSDIKALSTKFEMGEIGSHSSENKQVTELLRLINEYINAPWEKIEKYSNSKNLYDARVIPYSYISRRAMSLSAFKADKMGATNSIKRTLAILIDSDKLREVGKLDLTAKYGTTQRCFVISDMSILN